MKSDKLFSDIMEMSTQVMRMLYIQKQIVSMKEKRALLTASQENALKVDAYYTVLSILKAFNELNNPRRPFDPEFPDGNLRELKIVERTLNDYDPLSADVGIDLFLKKEEVWKQLKW